jgi:hypothetical protein
MSWFDKISKRLFSSDDRVKIHEVLNRTPGFIDDYKNWMDEEQLATLKHDVLRSWNLDGDEEESPVEISILRSDYANGFTIYPKYYDSRIPLAFLMEYLKDQLINIGYRLAHADRKMNENQTQVEILEKYYLKPPRSLSVPRDQLYGNVIVELLKHGQEEIRLQFLVNIYSDRLYTKAMNFSDLLAVLFDN